MSHRDMPGPGLPLPECTPSPFLAGTVASSVPSCESSLFSRESSPSDHEGPTQTIYPHEELVPAHPYTWDTRITHSEFKYRVWFTWCLLKFDAQHIPQLETVAWKQEAFLRAVSGVDSNEDYWLWENEDEGYIKDHLLDRIPDSSREMSASEWATACYALEARQFQHRHSRIVSPVTHLASQTRLRFIVWLFVANVRTKEQLQRDDLDPWAGLLRSIEYWRISVLSFVADYELEHLEASACCGISDLLNIWLGTMLQIYSVEELQWIPSYAFCNCFQR
ncbi:hypothetical protein B0H14DRAFT_3523246 [Mycena olivaceomarginata]|nr:hypothetical protein B0H14DRAFT_3523246 [Mycena olivaceomarginata]